MPTLLDILIIDDDEAFASVLARTCRRRGLQPACAQNGDEALALLRERQQAEAELPPPRIVLDLKLGQQSGLMLIEPILDLAPEALIVILTGYSSIATAVEAVKLGAVQYLCKPATVDEILAAFEHTEGDADVALPENPLSVDRMEWEYIQRTLAQHQGNISATARALGMHRRTLQRKLYKRPARQ